jgi:cellobiose phosphorylase
MAKAPQHIRVMEASLAALVRNALAAREKLSVARQHAGLRDVHAFATAAEVAELRAEHHDEFVGFLKSQASPSFKRMAELGFRVPRKAQRDYETMQEQVAAMLAAEEEAERETERIKARAIIRAGEPRRAERS